MATNLPEVTATDVPAHYHGDVEDFSADFLNGKLGEVVDQIHSRWGTLVAARLESGRLTERLFKSVVVRVASRVFSNPEGFRKENGGQYGYELNPAVASGTLWFTDDDQYDLTGIHPKRSPVLGTATIGRHVPRWTP